LSLNSTFSNFDQANAQVEIDVNFLKSIDLRLLLAKAHSPILSIQVDVISISAELS
jgi:hypothetical protein